MSSRASNLLKFIDKNIGPAILWSIGFIRKKRIKPAIKKLGLFKEAAIGDTVLLTSIVEDIKNAHPEIEIVFICSESNFIMAQYLKADRVLNIPIKNPLKSLHLIRQERFDAIIDYGAWPRINALLCAFSGAKFTAGFKTPGQRRHFAYDKVICHSNECHELKNYQMISKLVGFESDRFPSFNLSIPRVDENYLVFHLWAGGYRSQLREWPNEFWIQIMSHYEKSGLKIYLTGNSEDQIKNKPFTSLFSHVFAFEKSFSDALSLIQNARVVVSVNTGIMHLSAALGATTIGLSGPTNVKRWGPIGKHCYSLVPEIDGCQFLNLGFEYEGQREDCMNHIPPKRLIDLIEEILRSSKKD